jgi:hypothetical protein
MIDKKPSIIRLPSEGLWVIPTLVPIKVITSCAIKPKTQCCEMNFILDSKYYQAIQNCLLRLL